MDTPRFASFRDFYPFYLSEHSHRTSRRLHVVGLTVANSIAAWMVASGRWRWLPAAFAVGYAFAWVGHYFFEHNRPATFRYPLYSFIADYVMAFQVLTGRIPF